MNSKVILYDVVTGEEKTTTFYSLPAKQALINWIMSNVQMNRNTWEYPESLKGVIESKLKKGVYYYICKFGVLQAMEMKQ